MMKQEDLFKKLGLILDELNDQYQFLAQNPQQFNELELALFLANVNFLADHIQIIKKINETQPVQSVSAPAEEKMSEPIEKFDFTAQPIQEIQQVEAVTYADEFEAAEEPYEEEAIEEPLPSIAVIEEEIFKLDDSPSTFEFILNDHAEHEKFDFEEKNVDEIFNRPLSAEEERILAEKMKLREQLAREEALEDDEDEVGPEPFLVYKEEEEVQDFPIKEDELELQVAPIATVTVNHTEPVEDPTFKPTLNDLLAKSVKGNANQQPQITDLKQAINLNDKLLYIKDLFNGYNLAYAEAIDLANKLPNFEAADNFFQKNYAIKNNWAAKQATVDKFYELLNQRFRTPNP